MNLATFKVFSFFETAFLTFLLYGELSLSSKMKFSNSTESICRNIFCIIETSNLFQQFFFFIFFIFLFIYEKNSLSDC